MKIKMVFSELSTTQRENLIDVLRSPALDLSITDGSRYFEYPLNAIKLDSISKEPSIIVVMAEP